MHDSKGLSFDKFSLPMLRTFRVELTRPFNQANLPFDQGAVAGVTQTHLPYGLIDSVVAAARTDEEKRRVELIKSEITVRVGKVGRWDWS
jgi:hypothetical protein